MDTSAQIEQDALQWLTRRAIGPWSEADQREWGEWLRADLAHRVTFLRLEVGWERTGRLKAFGAGKPAGIVPAPGEWRSSPFFKDAPKPTGQATFKVSARPVAVAASVLLIAVAGFYVKASWMRTVYETPIGTMTSIPLSDGSNVLLNTQSKMRVALDEKERRIELEAGEAFFDVAQDPLRPFVVQAGARRIVAVGTRFSVRRDAANVQVIVTEGRVRIEPGEAGGTAELLTAGARVHTTPHALLKQQDNLAKAEEALSWRSGYLTFDGTRLADAVAEFNRYTPQKIVIDDPTLAALRISGKFRATYAEDFVQLLRNGSGVHVRRADGTLHLSAN